MNKIVLAKSNHILLLLVVSIFAIKNVYNGPLDPWDEPHYIASALVNNLNPYSWAPLYKIWYKLISFMTGNNPSLLFKFSHGAIFVGSFLAFYSLIHFLTRSVVSGLLFVVILVSWNAWLLELNLVNHFNQLLFVIFLNVILRKSLSFENKLFMLALFSLFLCYCRQDNLLLAFGLVFCILVNRIFKIQKNVSERSNKRFYIYFGFSLGLLIVLFYSYSPFENRGWLAFIDHYFWIMNPNNLTQKELIKNDFNNASSILQAFQTNPRAMLSYIFLNLSFNGRWPDKLFIFNPFLLFAMTASFITIIIYQLKQKLKLVPSVVINPNTIIIIILTTFHLARTIISVALFEPFFRYFFESVIWIVMTIFVVFPINVSNTAQFLTKSILGLAFIFAFSLPITGLTKKSIAYKYGVLFTEVFNKMKSIPLENRKSFFPANTYALYLGSLYANVTYPWSKNPELSLEQWGEKLSKLNIDVIFFDEATGEPINRYYGKEGVELLKRKIVTSCYDTLIETKEAEVYVRKSGCFN